VSQNSQRDWDFLLQGWSSIFGTPGQIYVGANTSDGIKAKFPEYNYTDMGRPIEIKPDSTIRTQLLKISCILQDPKLYSNVLRITGDTKKKGSLHFCKDPNSHL
jgi:hypothetical protein